jgi:MHS family proline/betaine transporter-like MFS transporter
MFVVFFYLVVNYMVLSYMPSHLSTVLGYGETKGLLLILIVMLIMVPIVLLMGYFGDRIGAKRVIQIGLIGLALLSVPSFLLIGSGNTWLVFLGLLILAVFSYFFQGTMTSLFFTEVRNGALAISYNISASLFGGTTPLLVAWLIKVTSNRMVPAYYLIFASIIGIVIVTYFVKDTSGKPLRGSPPAVAEKHEIKDILEEPEESLWWTEEKKELDQKIEKSEDD